MKIFFKVKTNKKGQFIKKTNEEVIKDLSKVFKNENYDYSKVNYLGTREDVTVVCRKHGSFKRRPEILYKKRGCFSCLLENQRDKFIKKSNQIHQNKYDYSQVLYIKQKKKVLIKCKNKLHGLFLQTPDNHMSKKTGCPLCARELQFFVGRKSNNQFIKEVKKVHKKNYDLSKVTYDGAKRPIIVKCKIHGEFTIEAYSFLKGSGCYECSLISSGLKRRKTNEAFIQEAIKIHGNTYDYSKCNYKVAKSHVIIICKKHGEFEQYPDTHLSGNGCNDCGNEKIGDKRRNSIEKVKNILIKKRGANRFEYPHLSIEYKSNRSLITIKCNIHNKFFKQTVTDHERCGGCEDCKFKSHGEELIMLILKDKKIKYIHNWNKHDCYLDKGKAKFDFYLPEIKKVIEFDGEQHFSPIQFSGMSMHKAVIEFQKRKKFDLIKNKWCKKNKLPLLRIKHNENIHLKLKSYLN